MHLPDSLELCLLGRISSAIFTSSHNLGESGDDWFYYECSFLNLSLSSFSPNPDWMEIALEVIYLFALSTEELVLSDVNPQPTTSLRPSLLLWRFCGQMC